MILAEITETGREVAFTFRPIVHQHQKEWFDVLSKQELDHFINYLHRLQAVLTDSE